MKLSIITTCYNQRKEIERLINSVLQQNIPFEYEILIGDDGSTDNSVRYLKEMEIEYPNIIKVYYNDSVKETLLTIHSKVSRVSDNRYRLLKEMLKHKSEYFTMIDGDDYYTEEKCLEDAINLLDKRDNIQGICYNHYIYDNVNKNKFEKNLSKIMYNSKNNILNKEYYQLVHWHHVAAFIFRAKDIETAIEELGKYKLVDDGLITLKMMEYSTKNKGGGILYNKNKCIFTYVVHNTGIWNSKEELNSFEKNLLTIGIFAEKLYKYDGKRIALRAASNYKILFENEQILKQLPTEIIRYYKELYEFYNDKILVRLLTFNKTRIEKLVLKIKIKFIQYKYNFITYYYKKINKILNYW